MYSSIFDSILIGEWTDKKKRVLWHNLRCVASFKRSFLKISILFSNVFRGSKYVAYSWLINEQKTKNFIFILRLFVLMNNRYKQW